MSPSLDSVVSGDHVGIVLNQQQQPGGLVLVPALSRRTKGGSSGLGGSSGSGSGGGFYNDYNYGSGVGSGGGGGKLSPGLTGFIAVVIILGIMIFSVIGCRHAKREGERKRAEANRMRAFKHFPDRVAEAKAKYDENEEFSMEEKPVHEPKSGEYDVVYTDRGKMSKGVAHLTFKDLNDGRGYNISGKYVDRDGEARIEQGCVRRDGSDAYWVDDYVSGNDFGMNVLNRGVFDFQLNKFEGCWYSSTGYQGEFKSFELRANSSDTITDLESQHVSVDGHDTPLSPLKTSG